MTGNVQAAIPRGRSQPIHCNGEETVNGVALLTSPWPYQRPDIYPSKPSIIGPRSPERHLATTQPKTLEGRPRAGTTPDRILGG